MGLFRRKPKPAERRYALCEQATGTRTSSLHIRELSDFGLMRGGGADTLALCGVEVAWDCTLVTLHHVRVEMNRSRHDSYWYCPGCARELNHTAHRRFEGIPSTIFRSIR